MNFRPWTYVAGILLGLSLLSCVREEGTAVPPESAPATRNELRDNAPGIIRIHTGHELSEGEIASLSPQYTVTRTFPPAGEFEEKHRKAGLHLWYDVLFDPSEPLTRASADLSDLLDIRETEFLPLPEAQGYTWPFNDPQSATHWEYWNEGTKSGQRARSDIRLLPAWAVTTGIPEVIVAVNDTGVESSHEDLAGNMWVNEAEKNGRTGVDDDGNGFVDDIHGFNFCYKADKTTFIGQIEPGDHGTHVAGTIAAVNNNGIGGCGIAGGNGSPDSGIRIMTTQTMSGTASTATAFVYAADMGALLINCSWSYSDRETAPSSFKTAAKYFNENAGTDASGRQTGLMKGGLIVFAAGNGQGETACPAMEESVFSVASIGADYVRAYYSNYGDWVDITAPGGDSKKGYTIFSTLPGNSYGKKQGTSMAAPHVTGVAALVISHFGGPGFTREKLIGILQNSADRVIYEYNPDLAGKLGAGLVDAFAALSGGEDPVPSPVMSMNGSAKGNSLTIEWPLPENGFLFDIYYGKESLASLDPDALPKGVSVLTMFNPGKRTGETVSTRIDGLAFSTPYHFRIGTESVSGRKSELSKEFIFSTEANRKPEITPLDGTSLTLKANGSGSLRFEILDPENQPLTHKFSPSGKGFSTTLQGNIITLEVHAKELEDDKTYEGVLSVSDPYDTTELPLLITVQKNSPPVLKGGIENLILSPGSPNQAIDLRDIFSDPDGDELVYKISYETETPSVRADVSGNILNIRPDRYGETPVSVKASDYRGTSATVSFSVLIRDTSQPVDLFPNPVLTTLTIRPGAEVHTGIKIFSTTGEAVFAKETSSIGPFTPLPVDLSALAPGKYTVILDGESVKGSYPIVKL